MGNLKNSVPAANPAWFLLLLFLGLAAGAPSAQAENRAIAPEYSLEAAPLDLAPGTVRDVTVTVRKNGRPVPPGTAVQFSAASAYPNLKPSVRETDEAGQVLLKNLQIRHVEPLTAAVDGRPGLICHMGMAAPAAAAPAAPAAPPSFAPVAALPEPARQEAEVKPESGPAQNAAQSAVQETAQSADRGTLQETAMFNNTPSFTDADQNPISAQEAFALLLTAAEGGSVPAMLNAAEFYGNGWGVSKNYTERFRWYQKAGEAGDIQGLYRAALCLEVGLGVTADPAAARAGFEKAAEAGLPEAHLKVAEALLAAGGEQARAAAHLEKSLAGGLPLAGNILGLLYLHGAGNLAADEEKARQAIQRGAELGDAEALKNLAVMHRQGWGGPQNSAEALKWYLAARASGWQGDGEALDALRTELGPQAAQKAETEARAWLESRKAALPAG